MRQKELTVGAMVSVVDCYWLSRFNFSFLLFPYSSPISSYFLILYECCYQIMESRVEENDFDELEDKLEGVVKWELGSFRC